MTCSGHVANRAVAGDQIGIVVGERGVVADRSIPRACEIEKHRAAAEKRLPVPVEIGADRTGEAPAGAGACRPPISAAAEPEHCSSLCFPLSASRQQRAPSVPSPFREPAGRPPCRGGTPLPGCSQIWRARLSTSSSMQLLVFLRRRRSFSRWTSLFLPLHVRGREQLVIVQRVEQFVVFRRALLLDIAEARIPDSGCRACRCARPPPARYPSNRPKWRPLMPPMTRLLHCQ